jgi:hypothetical protein
VYTPPAETVASPMTPPLVSIMAIPTLTELWLAKVYSTDAPSEERTEPMAPQPAWLPPLTLTLSGAACVGFGVDFGDDLGVGLGLGLGEDLGVDLAEDGTDAGAEVCAACVVAAWVVGRTLGRLDGETEACGEVLAADGDGWSEEG